jgi:hypothetical protein
VTAPALSDALLRAFDKGDCAATGRILRSMDMAARRALAPAVTARAKEESSWSDVLGPLLVAGLACASTPTQASAWFHRRSLRWAFGFHSSDAVRREVQKIIDERDAAWQADFATRIADGLSERSPGWNHWELAADLIVRTGAPAPTGVAFVRGWARKAALQKDIAIVAADPLLPSMLPHLFEMDAMGGELGLSHWHPAGTPVPMSTLGRLVADGVIDRTVALAGTLARLRLGDDTASIRYFARLHGEIDPTVAEIGVHADDYQALLVESPGPVATLAQKALRTLDEATGLSSADMISANESVLARSEASLVTTQLSWTDRVIRRHACGDLVATVSIAFGNPKISIAERALAIAIKHVALLDDAGRARIADAATVLPGDVQARAAAVFAIEPILDEQPIELVAAPRRPMPTPIETPAELAGAVVAHIADVQRDVISSVDLERLLDGLIRLMWQNDAAVVDALTPVRDRDPYAFTPPDEYRTGNRLWLPAHVSAVLGAVFPDRRTNSHRAKILQRWGALPGLDYQSEPATIRVVASRLDEIVLRMRTAPVPFLLATPTEATGHIAAMTLVERITAYERQGVLPWPYDLEQALLRLPWCRDDAAVSAAAALTSDAGRSLASWLESGPPGMLSVRHMIEASDNHTYWGVPKPTIRTLRPVVTTMPDVATHGPITGLMLTYDPSQAGRLGWRHWAELWPAILPSHREAIAAKAVFHLRHGVIDDDRGVGVILPLLAECEGPAGPAMVLAIAYGFGVKDLIDRTAVLDAAMDLAAAGDLDTEAVGREIGGLCVAGVVKLSRVATALAEFARIGATDAAATIAIACAGAVLSLPKAPPGLADLLELAARHYRPTGTVEVSGLAELAARSGSGRTVVEARRLQRLLTARTV